MNAILDGTKTVELRRTAPSLEPGALVVLYSSAPVKSVVGAARLAAVAGTTPEQLWRQTGARVAGVTREEFRTYFAGASRAYGLGLESVVRAACPVPLVELRSFDITPPQSWRYLDAAMVEVLMSAMRGGEPPR